MNFFFFFFFLHYYKFYYLINLIYILLLLLYLKYIVLYHKERKSLIEQNKKLIEKINLLKDGKQVSVDDIKEFTTDNENMPVNFIKFDNGIKSNDNINADSNNNPDNIDQLSIINNSDVSVLDNENDKPDKSNDIFENMDNVINDNVYDFTACRYCSSKLITL